MTKRQKIDVALPEELLNSFAKALMPEIRAFYDSDLGKAYFEKWLAKHPEYTKKESRFDSLFYLFTRWIFVNIRFFAWGVLNFRLFFN